MRPFFLILLTMAMTCAGEMPASTQVICFGDSITAGKQTWPDLLQTLSGGSLTTINRGTAGRSLEAALKSEGDKPSPLDGAIRQHKQAGLIIIFLGVNDAKWLEPGQEEAFGALAARYGAAVKAIRAQRPELPILLCAPCNIDLKTLSSFWKTQRKCGPHTVEFMRRLAERVAVTAREEKTLYCDLEPVVDSAGYSDGVHLNAQGQQGLFRRLADRSLTF